MYFKNDELVMEKFEVIRLCWYNFFDDVLMSVLMYFDVFDFVLSFIKER